MKKFLYLLLGSIFGLLLSFLAHAIIEIPVILIMVSDFEKYSFGLSWPQLMLVHIIFTISLSLAGLFFGLWLGFRWWRHIYIDKK